MARTQVNVRLRDGQKQRWNEHAEESRYDDSLSDLVKRAVENQIDRDNETANDSVTEAPEAAVSGEVLDQLQDLQNIMQDLEAEVSQAVDAVHAQEGPDPDLQPIVLENLPGNEEEAVTAAELAHILGEQPSTIRFALENIARNTNIIEHKRPTEVVETEHGTAATEEDPIWWRTE